MNVPVARAAAQVQRDRWEEELREVEAQLEALKERKTPVRHELERLGKKKMDLMRKLGMV